MSCMRKHAWQMRENKISENKKDLSIIYIFLRYLDKWTRYLDMWIRYLEIGELSIYIGELGNSKEVFRYII
jgi:hypothetical protein